MTMEGKNGVLKDFWPYLSTAFLKVYRKFQNFLGEDFCRLWVSMWVFRSVRVV